MAFEIHRTRWRAPLGVLGLCGLIAAALLLLNVPPAHAQNLLGNPGFETTATPNRFGSGFFAHWLGTLYGKPSRFEVSDIAHSGQHSCEMVADYGGKIRIYPAYYNLDDKDKMSVTPGRYRVTAFIRGLDVGVGQWNQSLDFSVGYDGKFYPLKRADGQPQHGTFGWTPLSFVFDYTSGTSKRMPAPFIGLVAPGRLWLDDVALEKVDDNTALTPVSVLGAEEKPIAPPGELGENPVRCPECLTLNNSAWDKCYACGHELPRAARADVPLTQTIADFEDGKTAPFHSGEVVTQNGTHALKVEKGALILDAAKPLDWSGYDDLRFDVYNPNAEPTLLLVEIRDTASKGYWDRVNWNTVAPPGESTVTIPTNAFVGEKSRPGRALDSKAITRLAITPQAGSGALYYDNFRLERTDTSAAKFDGLTALDFGLIDSPVLAGFERAGIATDYTPGRKLGWVNAKFWRAFNVLQPDPLAQDFVCPTSGTFRLDVPNGKYHVMVMLDSPGGYWGERQIYDQREVRANGQTVISDKIDFDVFKKAYFRNAHREDLPGQDTFDAYAQGLVPERKFEVNVTGGHLDLSFIKGQNWEYCLSALVVYPDAKVAQGENFLQWMDAQRRRNFDDNFKQVVHPATGEAAPATGYRVFARDLMDVPGAKDGPRR